LEDLEELRVIGNVPKADEIAEIVKQLRKQPREQLREQLGITFQVRRTLKKVMVFDP
jgi:hypothetical protein